MHPALLFLFAFQSLLAFVFTFVITRTLSSPDGPSKLLIKVRRILIPLSLTIVGTTFLVYRASLPEDGDPSSVKWPTLWIGMICFSVILALYTAPRKEASSRK